jgi:hypothetical protein
MAPPRRLRAWVLFVVVVVAAFFGLTYSRTSLDDSAIKLDALDHQITEQEGRHSELRAQVAELRDPRRIDEKVADAGFVFARDQVTLTVERTEDDEVAPEERWAQLKSLLGAQPGTPRS